MSSLFEQHHLSGGSEVAGIESIEVDAAGNGVAGIVGAIPHHAVVSGRDETVAEQSYLPAHDVVDGEANIGGLGQGKLEGGAGVEGVGVVLAERIMIGQSAIVVADIGGSVDMADDLATIATGGGDIAQCATAGGRTRTKLLSPASSVCWSKL